MVSFVVLGARLLAALGCALRACLLRCVASAEYPPDCLTDLPPRFSWFAPSQATRTAASPLRTCRCRKQPLQPAALGGHVPLPELAEVLSCSSLCLVLCFSVDLPASSISSLLNNNATIHSAHLSPSIYHATADTAAPAARAPLAAAGSDADTPVAAPDLPSALPTQSKGLRRRALQYCIENGHSHLSCRLITGANAPGASASNESPRARAGCEGTQTTRISALPTASLHRDRRTCSFGMGCGLVCTGRCMCDGNAAQ